MKRTPFSTSAKARAIFQAIRAENEMREKSPISRVIIDSMIFFIHGPILASVLLLSPQTRD